MAGRSSRRAGFGENADMVVPHKRWFLYCVKCYTGRSFQEQLCALLLVIHPLCSVGFAV